MHITLFENSNTYLTLPKAPICKKAFLQIYSGRYKYFDAKASFFCYRTLNKQIMLFSEITNKIAALSKARTDILITE